MGFTRSTANMEIHQSLSDNPSIEEGISAADLKELFDSGAVTLQVDLNRLEQELEASAGAAKLGAAKIYTNDTSSANVQAKLAKLYALIQEVAQAGIVDGAVTTSKLANSAVTTAKINNGAVTSAKIDSTYEATLAKKNGTLQSNLYAAKAANAETLENNTLAQIMSRVSSYFTTGTVTVSGQASVTSFTIDLGFTPSLMVLVSQYDSSSSYNYVQFGIIFNNQLTYFNSGDYSKFSGGTVTINNGVVTIPRFTSGTLNYIAFKSII